MTDCFSCKSNAQVGSLPPREQILVTEYWRVAHAIECSLRGWLVVVPRRHVLALDELDEEEAAELGPILRRVTRALREVTGCSKTYVALFAEAEGYAHVHFHVVPRMEEFSEDQRGPKSLHAFLGAGDGSVPDAEMDTIALALQRELD